MRNLFLILLLLVPIVSTVQTVAATDNVTSVVIEKRRVVLVRSGKFARDFPDRKRAILKYPVIKGPRNSEVLRKVRALLELKNIFDTSLQEYREDTWLSEFDYEVNYNRNYILDITFTQSGVGAYPDTHTRHFAINLRSGEQIKAADAFNASSLDTLAAMVDKKLQAEIQQLIKSNPETNDYDPELFSKLKFKTSDLDDFSINDKGVTFLYDAGFPHVIQAAEPDGRYFFSYAQLKPYIRRDGPLGMFVK
jgi:hypothetical protein